MIIPLLLAATVPVAHPTSQGSAQAAPPPPVRPKVIIAPSDKSERAIRPPAGEPQMTSREQFFYPGVISKSGEGGQDNFLNLSKSVAVQVNFIKAEGLESPLSTEKFQELIASIFQKGGISPASQGSALPFFNMIIMVLPTADGLVAVCQGRLFEQVDVLRVQLRNEIFQAITWEQTNIIFGPRENFEKMIGDAIEAIANTFVSRVTAQQQAASQAK